MTAALAAFARFMGIKGFLALGLGLTLAVVMWRADAISNERDELEEWKGTVWQSTRMASGIAKLDDDQVAIQIGYLGDGVKTLKASLDTKNEESRQRALALENATKQAERDGQRLDRAARDSDRRIDALNRMAAEQGSGMCEAPAELVDNLRGL